ncbi:O-antigen ligase family protein [Ideonella sp. DXS29W]|uniref:O-antigen ligase family protein n=1 Tax=Ideonella lacteola TaxID=2984193 RepID=A0ABU9BL29_9BURK
MLSQIKALVVILAVALPVFWMAAVAWPESARPDIRRWRWAFVLVTVLSFVTPSIWIYVLAMPLVVAAFLAPEGERAQRAAVLWALLMLAVPNAGAYIAGIGGISNFFEMTHTRALSFALLVPAIVMMPKKSAQRPGLLGIVTDWFVLAYFLVQLAVLVPYASTTDLIRQAFVLCVDTLLPYWVFSRAFVDVEGIRSALRAFVLVALALSVLAMFESVRRWPLYDAVSVHWGIDWDMIVFLERAGLLRAKASAGHSLMLGCVLLVAWGWWWIVQTELKQRIWVTLGTLGLLAGLAASLARGSWLGAGVLTVLMVAMGRAPVRNLLLIGGGGVAFLGIAAAVPALSFVIDMLPFVGNVDSENVEYRQRLLEISLGLIAQSPWLGVPGYLNYMEELRQGQGIIDIVNSYLAVALTTGVVGVFCFVGMLVSMMWGLWRVRQSREVPPDGRHMASCLLATTLALMFTLVTTSSIVVVLQLTYMLVGIGVSCARLYRPPKKSLQLTEGLVALRQQQ